MSQASDVSEHVIGVDDSPARRSGWSLSGLDPSATMPVEVRMALELASADEMESGMARVVTLLRRACAAARVEWWAPDEGGGFQLRVSDGAGEGEHRRFTLGAAGVVVIVGGRCDPRPALAVVVPILRRRWAEEGLTRAVMSLTRRNEALEEFAALVAHELKTPLQAALIADDAHGAVEDAVELVESLLEAARDSPEAPFASAGGCLDQVLQDLGVVDAEVSADLTVVLPLPPVSLCVILRNLLRNALAAGASHVSVVAGQSPGSCRLVVDDDGVGLAAAGYGAGNGLGLSLCRHIAGRYGGVLELAPRPGGGTRATLRLTGTS
jgi:signal transduction histidine kinase